MAKLNHGPGHPQSQPGRFPSHVVVSNLSRTPHSNSDSEPGTTLADKNDIELGKVPGGRPGIPYEF